MGLTDKLDELMTSRGINKNQLAKESNIPYTTIVGLYTKGSENVKLSTLRKLAEYFGCSLDYLVDDTHDPSPSQDDEIRTIAAHHDKEDWSDEELDEVERFKEWVRSKRKQK